MGGVAQLRLLEELGVPLDRVILSHTDKVADRGYHRELLSSGAYAVYDQGIRDPEGTARLVRWMVSDGHGDRLLLGTDGARRSLWSVLGAPGLAALHPPGQAAGRRARPGGHGPHLGRQPGRRPGAAPVSPGRLEGKVRRHRGHRHGRRRGPPVRPRGRRGLGRRRDRDQCEALGLPYALADLRDEGETEAAFAALRRAHPGSTPSRRGRGQAGGRSATGRCPRADQGLGGHVALNATPAFLAAQEALRAMLDQPPGPRPPAARWC